MPEREHIPTIASAYGAFLHALHEPAPLAASELPGAHVHGFALRRIAANARRFLTIRTVLLAALVAGGVWLGVSL